MRRRSPEALASLATLALFAGGVVAVVAPTRASDFDFEVLVDRRLPDELAWPRDVRWSGGDSTDIALSDLGSVVEISLAPDGSSRPVVAAPEAGPVRSLDRRADRLALGPDHLVVGSMAFTLRWKQRSAAGFAGEYHLEYIADLDLFEDRLLVAGIRRDDEGRLGADGAIAWLGKLGDPWEAFREILPSRSGPGVRTMEECAAMEVSAVRFLPDGSFVIAPGADPGVFLYGPDGRLRRTWSGDPLGIGDPCDMPKGGGNHYSSDADARFRWINNRRIVEEILPLSSGPAVVVRERAGDAIVWDFVHLHDDGSVSTIRLPVTSRILETRLRGDVLGDRLALLIATWIVPDDGRPPQRAQENRLVVLRVVPREGDEP